MKRGNFPNRKDQKRSEGALRQAEYSALTPKQKLDRLDAKLGKDVGAKRERAKIALLLDK